MSLDDKAVYVFVRGDLAEEDQMVQAIHATLEMAMRYKPDFAKYRVITLDCGQSEKGFRKAVAKLVFGGIDHSIYEDSDHPEWGATAIVTVPLNKEQALPLANYRLRKFTPSSEKECIRKDEVVGSSPTG